MKRKIICGLIICATCSTLLYGCGSKEDSNNLMNSIGSTLGSKEIKIGLGNSSDDDVDDYKRFSFSDFDNDYEKIKKGIDSIYDKYNTSNLKTVKNNDYEECTNGFGELTATERLIISQFTGMSTENDGSPLGSAYGISVDYKKVKDASDEFNKGSISSAYYYVYDPSEEIDFSKNGVSDYLKLVYDKKIDFSEIEDEMNSRKSDVYDNEVIAKYSNEQFFVKFTLSKDVILVQINRFYKVAEES